MLDMKPRVLIGSSKADFGTKIAVKLAESGIYAISHSYDNVAIANELSKGNFRAALIEENLADLSFPLMKTSSTEIFVLTDTDKNLISEKNGMLFLSKNLGIDSICEIIRHCTESDNSHGKLEKAATQIIQSAGIQANLKGYYYVRTAIVCAAKDPTLLESITNRLYHAVAQIHNQNSRNIERSIRNAIDLAYDRNPEMLQNFFTYNVEKPGNSEFIALAADKVRICVLC